MSIYTRIHKILEAEFGTLPKTGVLAGQAVAEAFFAASEINIVSRMKDLDWFVSDDEFVENPRVVTGSMRTPEIMLTQCSYDADLVVGQFVKLGSYRVLTSDVINGGRINRVIVRDLQSDDKLSAQTILDGFDINSAACAIDLDSKKVVTHAKFDEFCKTEKLDFISLHTPLSSLIRIIEKNDYIKGSIIDLPSLIDIASSAIWARYCYCYLSFEESHLVAPTTYQKGTGITEGRFNNLSDDVKTVLSEHFVKHTVFLSDGGAIATFLPKREPKKITTLHALGQLSVAVLSYSITLMKGINALSEKDFFENVVWPLKSLDKWGSFSKIAAPVDACIRANVFKSLYKSGKIDSICNALRLLRVEDVADNLGYANKLTTNQRLVLSDALSSIYLSMFLSDKDEVAKNHLTNAQKINALLDQLSEWNEEDIFFAAYEKMSYSLRTDTIKELIDGLGKGSTVPERFNQWILSPIPKLVDLKRVAFGFENDLKEKFEVDYSVKQIDSLWNLLMSVHYCNSNVFGSKGSNYFELSVEHKGEQHHVLCALVWSEYYANFKLNYRNVSLEDNAKEIMSIVDAAALHALNKINQSTRYKWKRIFALKHRVKTVLTVALTDLIESIKQRQYDKEISTSIECKLRCAPDMDGWDDDLPF